VQNIDREIWRLAVPAFIALVAQPLFLVADAAIIGHLGTPELAGLGIATSVLGVVISLSIFLAYGTTASVARSLGAGDPATAVRHGVDGTWLAVLIGLAVTAAGVPTTRWLVELFGAGPEVTDAAATYLRIALFGAVPMLVMLATTGVIRGLQDTKTPMVVAVAGNIVNVVLNLLLVYGLDLGIAGSAVGTLIAESGSALALWLMVARAARTQGVNLRFSLTGVRSAGGAGIPLILRTATLRACLLIMTFAAASIGDDDLAALQVAMVIWNFLAYALDAIAIAAQAITGRALGAGDLDYAKRITAREIQWGVASGVVTGLGLAALAPVVGPLFTGDPDVQGLLVPVLLVAAATQPIAGIVFVLDGVLIGAGDGRYLAWAGLVVLVVFAPFAWLATAGGITWLWVAFGAAFIGGRAVALTSRERSNAWLRPGA
jgi:putative MATE family efflux protein